MALRASRARKVSGAFKKWAPTGLIIKLNFNMSKVTQPKQNWKTLAAQLALNEVSVNLWYSQNLRSRFSKTNILKAIFSELLFLLLIIFTRYFTVNNSCFPGVIENKGCCHISLSPDVMWIFYAHSGLPCYAINSVAQLLLLRSCLQLRNCMRNHGGCLSQHKVMFLWHTTFHHSW